MNTFTAALVGNPNTGKTTLFNALAGMHQRVGNYPGVTVETKKGQVAYPGGSFHLIDLPGTYSLAPRSPDEMVTVDLLLGQQVGEPRPDVVVSIVDASNLERNLYLTTQVFEMGVPVVLALNMIDVAAQQQIRIDAVQLAEKLGCWVVPIQANKEANLDKLKHAILAAAARPNGANRSPPFPEPFEREVKALGHQLGDGVSEFLLRRLLLDIGGFTETRLSSREPRLNTLLIEARERLSAAGCSVPAVEARARYQWLRTITSDCVTRPTQRVPTWTDRLDRLLTHKVWGTLVFLVLMFLVFQSIFTWAKPLMQAISWVKDLAADKLTDLLPPGPFTSLLIDGVLEGVGAVVVFLPQIAILFGFVAILEDCGYMARAAFLMDRLMARAGLSGKSFIPMLSSVACAVPGIMATRVIEHRRDRLATILVAPLMSCSARLPVYVLLIGAFLTTGFPWWLPGLVMFAMYALGLVLAPLVAFALKRTLLRGETPLFIMEMPLYQWPSLKTVLRRVFDSSSAFLYRAGTFILLSMVLVWFLLYVPSTDSQGQSYPQRIAQDRESIRPQLDELEQLKGQQLTETVRFAELEKEIEPVQERINNLGGEWKSKSLLGRMGHFIEPVVKPLGWDWRIGMAALASFPAREVVVGTLGIIYNLGKVDSDEILKADKVAETKLGRRLQAAEWDGQPGRRVFTVPVALSLMVFFALCCQCASTLAVIRRETNSWFWPVFTFVYMTALAYIGAFAVYQIGSLFS